MWWKLWLLGSREIRSSEMLLSVWLRVSYGDGKKFSAWETSGMIIMISVRWDITGKSTFVRVI